MLLAAILAGAGLTYLVLFYVVGPPKVPNGNTPVEKVAIMPIMVPNPAGTGDSVIKTVGPFAFVSQTGATITQDSLKGKIWVADVFFSTCNGICPKLSSGFQRIQAAFKGDPEVKLVSFTVDPEYDSLSVIRAYADQYGALDHQWYFLTGNKTDLYDVEYKDFFFSATVAEDSTVKFIHDEKLRLVDKEGRFRGIFYDGTNSQEVDSVIADIKRLKNEYVQK
jgi:protein SCO1